MFLITKNTFNIKIHILFYITMFVFLFTGNIISFLLFTLLIIFHEFGHILGGMIFKWKILKIIILPFGGLTVFEQKINTSLFEQFIVTLLGPVFQIFFYFILSNYFIEFNELKIYNYFLLFFNLLPIFPLDGSKFVYIIFCLLFPFKCAHVLFLIVSFVFIILLIIFSKFNLLLYIVLAFLIFNIIREFNKHPYIFNKFLLERYNDECNNKKVKTIKKVNNMYLCYRHVFFLNGFYYTEKSFLRKKFDKC